MAQFDMDRLGFEEGETLWLGYTIQADGKGTGNFRVLCDGEHDEASGRKLKQMKPVKSVNKEGILA